MFAQNAKSVRFLFLFCFFLNHKMCRTGFQPFIYITTNFFFLFSYHNGKEGNISFIISIFTVIAKQYDCHISAGSA